MADPTPTDRDTRIDEAVTVFLRAEQSGTPLDPVAWLSSHPDLRPELDQFLAARAFVRAEVADVLFGCPDEAGGFELGAEFDGLRIVRLIAAGGMGRVYEAEQDGLGRRVAVKAVRLTGSSADNLLRHLFQDEMRTAGRLAHEHVVPVFKAGERRGVPYLVMPLLAGTLRDNLAAGPLPPAEVAAVVGAVARAVEFAHGEGVLHRDVKPSNVLFDARGRWYLGDFGLAVLQARPGPAGSARVGTPAYMAPEQFAGRADLVDERTDVYGLGAVLYECLTARPPLPRDAATWTAPVPPAAVNPQVDRQLEALCRRCLAEHPADRYPSAAGLADALDQHLHRPSRRLFLLSGIGLGAASIAGTAGWLVRSAVSGADAEQAARDTRYQELMDQVRQERLNRKPGWTWRNRDALTEASQIACPKRDPVELRSEHASTFVCEDLRSAGSIAAVDKYEVSAFRPGTRGQQVVLGVCFRNFGADPDDPVRIDLYDRAADRRTRSWTLPFDAVWEKRRAPRRDGVRGLTFTPDGGWLFAGTRSGGVFVIDVADADAAPVHLRQEREAVKRLFVDRDGNAVLSVSLDGWVRRFERAEGHWRETKGVQFPTGYPHFTAWEPTCDVAPDTGDLIVCSQLGPGDASVSAVVMYTPWLVEVARREFPQFIRHPAPHPACPEVLLDLQGQRSVTCADLFHAEHPFHEPVLNCVMPRYLERMAFDRRGRVLVVACDGQSGLAKFHDTAGFNVISTVDCEEGSSHVGFAPDAPLVTVARRAVVDVFEQSLDGFETRVGYTGRPIEAVGLRPDGAAVWIGTGRTVSTWRSDGRWLGDCSAIRLWLGNTLASLLPFGAEGFALVSHLDTEFILSANSPPQMVGARFSPAYRVWAADDRLWVWASGTGRLYRVGAPPGLAQLAERLPGPEAPADHPLIGGLIVLAIWRTRVFLVTAGLAVATFRESHTADECVVCNIDLSKDRIWSVAAFTPDGRRVVAGTRGGEVCLFDWPAVRPRLVKVVHSGPITAIAALSPTHVMSGGADGAVKFHRLTDTGFELLASIHLSRGVRTAQVSSDRATVAVWCEGEWAVRVWDLDRLEASWASVGGEIGLRRQEPPEPRPSRPGIPPPLLRGPGLRRDLYRGQWWGELVQTDVDMSLNHNWGEGPLPIGTEKDHISIVWSGALHPPGAGRYLFRMNTDDYATLWVNEQEVVFAQGAIPPGEWKVGMIHLPSQPVSIRIEYFEDVSHAQFLLEWSKLEPSGFDWCEIEPKFLSPHPPK